MRKLFFFGILLFCLTAHTSRAAFNYSRSITVTSTTSIASGTLANFPMLVSSTLASLKSTGNGGNVQSASGFDIVFATSTANCTAGAYLNYETESYTSSTGALIDWVQVPSESAGSVIQMCYGNSGITTSLSRPSSTFTTSTYNMVIHFPIGNLTNPPDSTGNKNNITTVTTFVATSSIIGGGANAEVSGIVPADLIIATTANINNPPGDLTWSAWVKLKDYPNFRGQSQTLFSIGGGSKSLVINTDGTIQSVITTNDSYRQAQSATKIATGTFQYIVATFTTSTPALTWRIFLNGQEVTYNFQNGGAGTTANDVNPTCIGQDCFNDFGGILYGTVDEARFSSVARTPGWILTEYNNQRSPSTFYAVGAETPFGGGSPIVRMLMKILIFGW